MSGVSPVTCSKGMTPLILPAVQWVRDITYEHQVIPQSQSCLVHLVLIMVLIISSAIHELHLQQGSDYANQVQRFGNQYDNVLPFSWMLSHSTSVPSIHQSSGAPELPNLYRIPLNVTGLPFLIFWVRFWKVFVIGKHLWIPISGYFLTSTVHGIGIPFYS